MGRKPRIPVGLGALVALALLAACTTGAPAPAATDAPSAPPAATSAGSAASAAPSGSAAPPTYFSPTDTGSFSMSGPFQVDQALQDPFSNLLQRGVLYERPVTLDVVGTPDYPVPSRLPGTLLFGTCKCSLRGQGMHLTVEDGSAISDAGAGAVRIRGTFRAVQTESDAFTLTRP